MALDAMDLLLRDYSAVGVLATPERPETEAAVWHDLADLAARRVVTTPLGPVYDFADVPRMITEQSAPGAGKSVVRLG